MKLSRKEVRESDQKYKVTTMEFFEVDPCCIARNTKLGKIYVWKDFDLLTMKNLSQYDMEKLDKIYSKKKKLRSILIEYHLPDNRSMYALHSVESFLINVEKIMINAKVDLTFIPNDTLAKHSIAKIKNRKQGKKSMFHTYYIKIILK